MKRLCIKVQGQVQGVGFRPYVYRLATELGLTGIVQNNAAGVHIEIQGDAVKEFLHRLPKQLPVLANIEQLDYKTIAQKTQETDFIIAISKSGNIATKIPPDASICDACLNELFNKQSRFYRYPFINCTHCGPRYTITYSLPYDRNKTAMSQFTMCPPCRLAYENPLDRRYHAEPIACAKCGPRLSHNIKVIAQAILAGKIIALKSLGGYQLLCDAHNQEAIKRLRKNKSRLAKPFAVMLLNTLSVSKHMHCNLAGKKLLTSRARPIVILEREQSSLPRIIAPNLSSLGIMLPYTPIHYLLFNALLNAPDGTDWLKKVCDIALIVTSANPGGCPLIKENHEAKQKLTRIADIIVSYNRDIVIRVDDSVTRIINNKPCFIRRARSFTPHAIPLPYEIPTTLALGGYLKNTVCITRGKEAFISQHIGDLSNRETMCFYRETVAHLLQILAVKPECVAHDLHPDFYSTKIAHEFNVPSIAVQHHHAHLAAVAVEHQVDNALGLALDGFGLGEKQASWGGELLHYQQAHYKRLGSLKPILQPGGDRAAKEPWRMAASVLFALGKREEIYKRFSKHAHSKAIIKLLEKKIHSPLTSSCGRLFDAASALLGVCEMASYEGQAAMELESKVTKTFVDDLGWDIDNNQLNMLPLFAKLINCDATTGANLFHGTLVMALVTWLKQNAKQMKLTRVLLSGGCFLNKILSEYLFEQLKIIGLQSFYPRQSPANDGGISLGQAWIAGNQLGS